MQSEISWPEVVTVVVLAAIIVPLKTREKPDDTKSDLVDYAAVKKALRAYCTIVTPEEQSLSDFASWVTLGAYLTPEELSTADTL